MIVMTPLPKSTSFQRNICYDYFLNVVIALEQDSSLSSAYTV